MRRSRFLLMAAGVCLWFGCGLAQGAEPERPAPDFKEVYDLVRAHLAGVSEAELNQTAVKALLEALGSKVSLVGGPAAVNGAEGSLVTRSNLFDRGIAYVRVGRVGEGLAGAVTDTCARLAGTNKLNGLVLDLRYTGGTDYAAAAAVAELFQSSAKPLLDWGDGVVISKGKGAAITVPAAVLVNRQTAAGAEALAGALRETGVALILGNRTAGQAAIGQEYPLSNGQKLKIATTEVRLGDGTRMPMDGLKPDIEVQVSPQEERNYYNEAFRTAGKTNAVVAGVSSTNQLAAGTNRPGRRMRFGEAELVRERREGIDLGEDQLADRGDGEPPVVSDPVLSRALDLLKGLAVVRSARP